jgi:hypothetical protein
MPEPGGSRAAEWTKARRLQRAAKLREETGLVVDELGPVVFRRTAQFDFEGVHYRRPSISSACVASGSY